MAQQTPNLSVQNHTEGPVFNQIVSNAGNGFLDETENLGSYFCRNSFNEKEFKWIKCLFDAADNAISAEKDSSIVDRIHDTVCAVKHLLRSHPLFLEDDWSYKWSMEPLLRFRDAIWLTDEVQHILARHIIIKGDISLVTKYFNKFLSFRRGGDYRQDYKWRIKNGFLDQTKYDSDLWEVDHSSFGKVDQSWMFREATSEQQLGSDEIVWQDFGDKSKWDMLGLSESMSVNGKHSLGQRIIRKLLALGLVGKDDVFQHIRAEKQFRLDSERRIKLLFFIEAAAHQENCKWRGKTRLDFVECPQNYSPSLHTGSYLGMNMNVLTYANHLSFDNQESRVAIGMDLMKTVNWDGKMTPQKFSCSTCFYLNKHKETIPKDPMFQLDDTFSKHKRMETTKRVPSFVIFPIICLWILLVTRSQTTSTHVQPLHKEHGPVSVGAPLLELFSCMVFVWAVAVMILVGAKITRMHSTMLLFWAILMHVRLDHSTSALYLPILGIFFIGGMLVEKQ